MRVGQYQSDIQEKIVSAMERIVRQATLQLSSLLRSLSVRNQGLFSPWHLFESMTLRETRIIQGMPG